MRKLYFFLIVMGGLLFYSDNIFAIDNADSPSPLEVFRIYKTEGSDNAEKALENITDQAKKVEAVGLINEDKAKEFWSYWGVGLVLNFDTGRHKPVKNANIVNGIVRVEEEEDVKYGLGLEVHKFLWGTTWQNKKIDNFSGGLAIGPYVSVLPGQNDIFDVIGAGVMFGFHGGKKNSWSMNIGVGGYVDPRTKILASGFNDGEAPPANETSVRFRTITQYGFQSVLSFSHDF